MRNIKSDSNLYINKNSLSGNYKFEWQEGFGAFSCSKSQLKQVISYIENQEEHHRKITFTDEYIGFLENYGVEYKPEYLFKTPE